MEALGSLGEGAEKQRPDRDLQTGELVFCGGSNRLGVIMGHYGFDHAGCALWEMHDGMGHQWLCPEYLIRRLPDNWDEMNRKAKIAFTSFR